jgi:hypothetical protein
VTRRRPILAGLALAAGVLASPGCSSDPTIGYAATSLYPDDVHTVAVPVLENETFSRGVEFELTDALVKEIEQRTPYKVAASSRADTILLGRISRVDLQVLSKSRLTGLSEEAVVGVTIDFQWKDQRTGRVLVKRESYTGQGLFVPSAPTGEAIDIGEFAAVQQLARDIVDEMRSNW